MCLEHSCLILDYTLNSLKEDLWCLWKCAWNGFTLQLLWNKLFLLLRTSQSWFTDICECYVSEAKECQWDMESVSNTLGNSGCLQHVDKQDTPSGTCQHFPHEVNEEEAKNMTEQSCKHCDKTKTQHIRQVKIQLLVLPDDIQECVREVRISDMWGSEKCRTKCLNTYASILHFTLISELQIHVSVFPHVISMTWWSGDYLEKLHSEMRFVTFQ